tara:strand:- start:2179 stop:2667 length:489 start_codon:yes stop_codon:yes gene_type:complete
MSDTCPFERVRDETLSQVKEMMDAVERRHGYEFFDRVLAEAYTKAVADKVKAEAQVAMLVLKSEMNNTNAALGTARHCDEWDGVKEKWDAVEKSALQVLADDYFKAVADKVVAEERIVKLFAFFGLDGSKQANNYLKRLRELSLSKEVIAEVRQEAALRAAK